MTEKVEERHVYFQTGVQQRRKRFVNTIYIKRECLFRTKYFIIALLCLLYVSCAGTQKNAGTDQSGSHDAAASSREYEEAGNTIAAALSTGNAEALISAINKEVLLDRVFAGINKGGHTIKKVRADLHNGLDRAAMIMSSNLANSKRMTFVRSHSVNHEHRALIRVDMGESGLSYLDFILDKDEQGAVKIVDWHDFAQGQFYSDSLRQTLILILPHNEMLIRTILGMPAVDQETVEQFSELARLSRDRKYGQWLEKYRDLPDNLKYSRIVLVTRALIASATENGNEYRLALQDVNRYLGEDPSLSLMLIDHYLLERDYKAAHRALAKLDEYTGGDAAVDFLKANICLTEKNYTQSLRHAQMAVKKDANFEDAYLTLLVASLYSKQYEIAVQTMDRLEYNFGYIFDPEDISSLDGYEEFSKSLVFAAWKAHRMSSPDR
jgi:hypothetical protein